MIFVAILLAPIIMLECHGYVHINSMQTYEQNPSKNNSLFGYSIAYQPGIQRLIITAPQENKIGEVYTTGLNASNIVKVAVNPILSKRSPFIKHDLWLGATVKATSKFFITCAPRYTEIKSNKLRNNKNNVKLEATLGVCLSNEFNDSDKYKSTILAYMNNDERSKNAIKFGEKMDSFGWSMDITDSGQVLIGSPAMMTGRVIFYNSPTSNPRLIYKVPKENSYRYNFGYSLTSGRFFNQNSVYAISSTFGYGKVYLFDSKKINIDFIENTEVGSTFGAALCAAQLGASALLIGAPTYSDNAYKHDIGAVFVYVDQTHEGSKQMLYKRTIKGPSSGSYFGHAIENLGDIDGDQKDEIVIAAPFENGNGAVYVYSGASILDEKSPPRRIQPKNYHSFGFSLTVLEDTDGNGSNELAIGSPKDNQVLVFNSFAVVTVKLSAHLHQKVEKSEEDYKLNYCIESYFKQENITADLVIVIELRNANFTTIKSTNGVSQFTLQLKNNHNIKNCQDLDLHVDIDESNISENKLLMSYNITVSLKEDPEKMTKFDSSRVLLSDQSVLNAYGEKWNDVTSIDEPKLNLEISSSMTEPYMIGSSLIESFTLSVVNMGGAAAKACMMVSVQGASVIAYPQSCTHITDGLLCRHNQIIKTAGVWEKDFKIDTNYLTSIHKNIIIKCDLYPQCGIKDNLSYEKTIALKPYNNMVEIKGQTNPEEIVSMTTEEIYAGKTLEHVYTIYNYGLTNWVGMRSEIILESSPFIDYSKTPIKIYKYTSSTECVVGTNNEDAKIRVSCEIGNMRRQEKVIVVIAIAILPGSLEFESNDQNVTVTTSLNLALQDRVKYLSLNTTLTFAKAEVPLWVTLASSFVGIFLMIIIAYILYEYGFLQRKTKEKLIEKKKELYRESVRRSMMHSNRREDTNRESERKINSHKQEDEDSV